MSDIRQFIVQYHPSVVEAQHDRKRVEVAWEMAWEQERSSTSSRRRREMTMETRGHAEDDRNRMDKMHRGGKRV
jgi:hypothetical protein